MNLWEYNKKELDFLKPEECYYPKKNSRTSQAGHCLLASLCGWIYNGPFFSPLLYGFPCKIVKKDHTREQIN